MLGSEIIDVAVGVVFVFLLVSLIASAIREGIEGWMKTRATHLEAGIRELLHDKSGMGLVAQLYNHPLIYGLFSGEYSPRARDKWLAFTSGANLPSYIPSRNFALALMDLAARGPIGDLDNPPPSTPISLRTLRANIPQIPSAQVQRALLTAIDTAEGDLEKAQANIEAWYDSAMDRVSGWYKRSTQWILLGIGLIIAIVMNVNAIAIGNYLLRNKAARETLVAHAQAASANKDYVSSSYSDIKTELQSFTLPIGWDYRIECPSQPSQADASKKGSVCTTQTTISPNTITSQTSNTGPPQANPVSSSPPTGAAQSATPQTTSSSPPAQSGASKPNPTSTPESTAPPIRTITPFQALQERPLTFVGGWLATALAATLGAPFWFDLLNRIMVVRSTVKPHQKSPEEGSEDRQSPADTAVSQPLPAPASVTVQAADLSGANPLDLIDGCDVRVTNVTRDEDLPAAQGGIS